MRREDLEVLNSEVEVTAGFTTKDLYPSIVVFVLLLPVSFTYAAVLAGITLVLMNSMKKKLGDTDKVYEFFRYLGRPSSYRRKG